MDWQTVSSIVTVFATVVTAIATGVIAYYSYVNNKLSNAIRDQETNYRKALEMMNKQHHKDLILFT